MRFCPWCGIPVTAAAQFCAGCAASLGPPAEAEKAGEEPVPPQPGPFPRMFGRPHYCPGPADHPVGAPDYPAGGDGYPPGPDHPRGPDGPAGRPVTVHPGPADGPVTILLPGWPGQCRHSAARPMRVPGCCTTQTGRRAASGAGRPGTGRRSSAPRWPRWCCWLALSPPGPPSGRTPRPLRRAGWPAPSGRACWPGTAARARPGAARWSHSPPP